MTTVQLLHELHRMFREYDRRAVKNDTVGDGAYLQGIAAGIRLARLHIAQRVRTGAWRMPSKEKS